MTDESKATLSLFCASLEEELPFTKLTPESIHKVVKLRDSTVFFTEYARLVIYAVIGKKKADTIWGEGKSPQTGGNHTLFELYWIATIINPELSWSLKTSKVEKGDEEEEGTPVTQKQPVTKKSTLKPMRDRLPQIESFLKGNVMGQEQAIDTVLDVIYRSAAGLSDPDRPQAVLLFTGPSGSGKSHLAKTLSVALYEDNPILEKISSPPKFFRIDCTLYQQRHEISNLIGSPQGYIGSDMGSPFPNFLKEHKDGCVVLIDEVEKAHPSLHKIFMGLFDYGKIKDNKQVEVSAQNAIFIMTSNAGSKEASDEASRLKNPLGFTKVSNNPELLTENAYKKKLEEIFPPEFRGRIDETVIFKALDDKAFRRILDLEIKKIERRLEVQNIKLAVTEAARQNIMKEATSPEFGARKLAHCISEKVTKPLARLIVGSNGKSFICRARDGVLKLEER